MVTLSNSPVVWVPTSTHTEHLHRLLKGIAKYRNEHRSWALTYPSPAQVKNLPRRVIGAIVWSEESDEILTLSRQIPCVQVSNRTPHRNIYAVTTDDHLVGLRAAEHFMDRGFRKFFFVGPLNTLFARERWEGYRDQIRRKQPDAVIEGFDYIGQGQMDQAAGVQYFFQTLQSHPPPWALFCADDWWARFIVERSRSYEISIPGDLSILGVNNETHVCEIADTPVSSVDIPSEKIGFEAAHLLDRLIHGERPATLHIRIPPARVITRASTDISAVPDPVVSKALSLMQHQMASDLDIPELARACGVSRRVLERRFNKVIHVSPYQRLLRFRVDHAKSLLRATNWPLQRIASECGFTEQKYLSVRFKQLEGSSPLQWRKQKTSEKTT